MRVLGVDIGTTSMKMGVFELDGAALSPLRQFSQAYPINVYNDGLFADIEPAKWKRALVAGCRAMADAIVDVEIVALSGTTPGLTAMDRTGEALHPAILMLDQRSRQEARDIINAVGLDPLLATTANMPVAGGCSLASILWLRNNASPLFQRTHKFGHSNTYIARWLTGAFAIDPSSASLTALYNTTRNNLRWNEEIASTFGLSLDVLPEIVPAYQSVGRVHTALARDLGLSREPQVLIGGNDAVLAALSVGICKPGQIINVNGTCEVTLVCLPECLPSAHYNIRTHVLPERWLTLHVMNAGGKALEWFKGVFCREMSDEEFYTDFIPGAIDAWLSHDSGVTYAPYLMGSRYSLEPRQAEFLGLTQTTTREELLAALVRGLCEYQRDHLDEIERRIPLDETIHLTGGAVSEAMIRAKRRWMRETDYVHEQESSVRGAAMLARLYLDSA
jgi:sugar (pentulose or hexulose) kinase